MNAALLLRWALRESRGGRGRLLAMTACLALGVAAVVAVTGSVDALQSGVDDKARDLLGADLVVEGRRPLPDSLSELIEREAPGARLTPVLEMASMAAVPAQGDDVGRSRLVELKVVDGTFPYYGELELDPPGALADALGPDDAVVGPDLLASLGLRPGDDIVVGGARFTASTLVLSEPDRLGVSFTLGPRVFLDAAGFARTELTGLGNRVEHKLVVALPAGVDREALADTVRRAYEQTGEVRDVDTAGDQPSVSRQLRNVERSLGLMALLSLVLGGVGVSQVVRAWIGARTQSVAIMRCLGMRPVEILVVFLGQVAVLALGGCLLGVVVGGAVPYVAPLLAPDTLPAELVDPFQPLAWLRGLGLGLGLALVFALPPLTALWRVAPAKVLRAEAAPLPAPRVVVVLCASALLGGIFLSALTLGDRVDLAGWFTGGLAAAGVALFGAARLVMWAVGRMPRGRVGPYLRHGLSALARPGAGTTGAVTALGLGVLVVLTVGVVADRLAESLRTALPENAPTAFLVDIQPDQWPEMEPLLAERAEAPVDSTPVVMARLAAIEGVPVADILRGDGPGIDAGAAPAAEGGERRRRGGRSRWVLTREQRLTWRADLPPSNRLTAAAVDDVLWSDPDRDEVSLEEGFAESLGVGVGDELVFDVQGVQVPLLVTSLRAVEWRSFAINFFVLAEPGVLDDAPHFRIASARLGREDQADAQDRIAARFSNVTMLDVRAIIEKLGELLTSLAAAIGALGLLTVVTGLAVLAGSVASTSLARGREAALLKTLGLTRRGVVLLFALEHGLLGVVAGAVGGLGGLLLAGGFLAEVVDVVTTLPWLAVPVAAVATGVLSALCGVAACRGALNAPPLASIRG